MRLLCVSPEDRRTGLLRTDGVGVVMAIVDGVGEVFLWTIP